MLNLQLLHLPPSPMHMKAPQDATVVMLPYENLSFLRLSFISLTYLMRFFVYFLKC